MTAVHKGWTRVKPISRPYPVKPDHRVACSSILNRNFNPQNPELIHPNPFVRPATNFLKSLQKDIRSRRFFGRSGGTLQFGALLESRT